MVRGSSISNLHIPFNVCTFVCQSMSGKVEETSQGLPASGGSTSLATRGLRQWTSCVMLYTLVSPFWYERPTWFPPPHFFFVLYCALTDHCFLHFVLRCLLLNPLKKKTGGDNTTQEEQGDNKEYYRLFAVANWRRYRAVPMLYRHPG